MREGNKLYLATIGYLIFLALDFVLFQIADLVPGLLNWDVLMYCNGLWMGVLLILLLQWIMDYNKRKKL